MDFGQTQQQTESVASQSNISLLTISSSDIENKKNDAYISNMLINCANQASLDLYQLTLGKDDEHHHPHANHNLYPHHTVNRTDVIQPNSLCVIFEAFDNLNFVYATPNAIFSNRNGHFHHNDFLNKPYGCKIRSRNRQGFGFVYILRPTSELWARSLNHRTQIIHELDASVIVSYLKVRPNMIVCESGTGSGSMSHAFLRTIAPYGHLHTYEFNKARAEAAREEFRKNKCNHLVTVYHRDVCGKKPLMEASSESGDNNIFEGFGPIPSLITKELKHENVADAVLLDLPEPWLAVPHAKQILKPNARLGSYSPCVEQSQKTIQKMTECGFHSIQTFEVRLKEYYVDQVEMEMPPTMKLPDRSKSIAWNHTDLTSLTKKDVNEESKVMQNEDTSFHDSDSNTKGIPAGHPSKKRKLICTRPAANMRGHTAFLTFATAGLV